MRVALYTLGCKVNQFDTDLIAQEFVKRGAEIVPFNAKDADIYVINTCAVTSKAAYQSRQMIRRALKQNPSARVIATGCYVQADACTIFDKISTKLCLIGNDRKYELVDLSLRDPNGLECYVGDIFSCKTITSSILERPFKRTRAFFRIQDGCNAFCSYCIVPYTRGPSRSLPLDKVIRQLEIFIKNDIKEIVFTGIHLGAYGLDLTPKTSLLLALQEISKRFKDEKIRIRLSSIEPSEISDDIIYLIKEEPIFCHHFHIPLQSGSEDILSRMGRPYTPKQYEELVFKIKDILPDAAIGSDLLVGFPGEKEDLFLDTYNLLLRLPVTYIHAFPFSPRPGTVAQGLPNKVPNKEKARRVKLLRELSCKKKEEFYKRFLGETLNCLIESRLKDKRYLRATSDNYIPVFVKRDDKTIEMINKIVPIKITAMEKDISFGEMI